MQTLFMISHGMKLLCLCGFPFPSRVDPATHYMVTLACLARDIPMGAQLPRLHAGTPRDCVSTLMCILMNTNNYLINDNKILLFVSTMLHNLSIIN